MRFAWSLPHRGALPAAAGVVLGGHLTVTERVQESEVVEAVVVPWGDVVYLGTLAVAAGVVVYGFAHAACAADDLGADVGPVFGEPVPAGAGRPRHAPAPSYLVGVAAVRAYSYPSSRQ